MKFTKIPESTFEQLQLNAGVLVRNFAPATATFSKTDIVGATSGGTSFSAVPCISDIGKGINNCQKNTKELMILDGWDVEMSGTFVTITATSAKSMLAAADIDTSDSTKIVPRNYLDINDFEDIWWIGDYSDENSESNGGFIAIHMMNTLSTGGFRSRSGDNETGHFEFVFKAHYSIKDIDTVPFEIFIKAGGTT